MHDYQFSADRIKIICDKEANDLTPWYSDEFMFYHLNRNHFNIKNEVTSLTRTSGSAFLDNLGNLWYETAAKKNFFHMPALNYIKSQAGLEKAYSRKFLRDDTVTGLGGEFEIIIRKDGKRIDALTSDDFQETYNFGRTRDAARHTRLDILPHALNADYVVKRNNGWVKIIE